MNILDRMFDAPIVKVSMVKWLPEYLRRRIKALEVPTTCQEETPAQRAIRIDELQKLLWVVSIENGWAKNKKRQIIKTILV